MRRTNVLLYPPVLIPLVALVFGHTIMSSSPFPQNMTMKALKHYIRHNMTLWELELYSNKTLRALESLNLSTTSLSPRDMRIGRAFFMYLQARHNRTLRQQFKRRRRRNSTSPVNKPIDAADKTEPFSYEDYEYFDEDYPDFDFSPASILIYILELFGTLLGLTWGAISTIFYG